MFKKLRGIKHNQFLAIAHQLLMAVYGFGLLFILYRNTSKEVTGRWLLFSSAISMMDMLLHGFLQTPVIRKIALERLKEEQISNILSNAFIFSSIIWAILSVIILAASFIFPQVQLLQDLRWYPALGFFMIFFNICWWTGNALQDFEAVLVQRIIFCLTSSATILLLIGEENVVKMGHIIISQLVGYLISSFVTIIFIRKITISIRSYDKTHLKYFFDYGKYTSGSMLMGSLLRNADIFMIAGLLNQGAVAIYSAAQKTIEIFEVALRGVASHALPEFCKCADDVHLLMKNYIRITSILMIVFVPVALLMSLFSQNVISFLSGSMEYNNAAILLRIFMIYVLFLVVDRMTGVTLEALGLAQYNLIKTVLLVAVNVIGNFIALFYFKSLAGVAAVSILAALTGTLSGFFFIMKHKGVSFSIQQIRSGINLVIK